MALKGRRRDRQGGFEAVPGGSVRRIEFEGDTPVEAFQTVREGPAEPPVEFQEGPLERAYRPRHRAPIDDIRFEVDHLHEIKAGHVVHGIPLGRTDLLPKEATLYRTERSLVTSAEGPSGRRILYTEGSSPLTRRRFTSALVDAIVKDVVLEEEIFLEEDVKASSPAPPEKKTKAPRKKPAGKPSPKKTPEAVAAPPAKKETGPRPQCAALTHDGAQCRNSARTGSKYCISHKGYRPKSMEEILESRDTRPAHKKAADTKPGKAQAPDEGDAQPQCAALTAAGQQCRNSARRGSKYCGAHKGYRPQKALAALDTRPRAKGAKDTKPAIRKS